MNDILMWLMFVAAEAFTAWIAYLWGKNDGWWDAFTNIRGK